VRPHRRTLAVAAVLALLGAAGGLAQPLAAREVIESLGDDRSVLTPLLVLGGLVVFSAAIVAIELWLLERTSERVVLGVRRSCAGIGCESRKPWPRSQPSSRSRSRWPLVSTPSAMTRWLSPWVMAMIPRTSARSFGLVSIRSTKGRAIFR
jgi:hypothetical protein